MKYNTQKFFKTIYICTVLLCAIFVILPISSDKIFFNTVYNYNAIDGVIDFKGKDISKDNNYLQGEWEFYWSQWIITDSTEPHEFTYQKIPSKWTKYDTKDDSHYPVNGYASYRVKITNYSTSSKYLSIDINNIRCAHRIFINGNKVLESGVMSKIANDTKSAPSIYIADYPKIELDGSDIDIVIEVATKYTAGMNFIPRISNFDTIIKDRTIQDHTYFIFVGLVLCACITFLIIRIFEGTKRFTTYSVIIFYIILFAVLFNSPMLSIFQSVLKINYEKVFYITFIFYSTIIYASSIFIYALLMRNSEKKKRNTILFLIIMSLYTIILFISIIFGILNIFEIYASYIWLSSLIPFLGLLCWIYYQIKKSTNIDFVSSLTYLTAFGFVLSALTLNLFYYNGFLHINILIFENILIVLTYLFIIIINSFRTNEIYAKSMEAVKLREQLSDNKASILLSQMQPHFLFNTLNSIVYLCRTDVDAAEDAIFTFSKFLRSNMSSISGKNLILFQNELDHIKNYVKIEKLRFGNKVKVFYRISTMDFFIPPLCVQPLVENAIRHGVTKKTDGGKIIISTWEDSDNFYISIADTGVGFNTKSILSNHPNANFSIINISNRLRILCNGELKVDSVIGQGTTSLVRIPKTGQNDKNAL